MRVLVCGGRDYGDLASLKSNRQHPLWPQREKEYRHILNTLHRVAAETSIHFNPNDNWMPFDWVIISGMARGVDSVAIDWAVIHEGAVQWEEYPANWDKYGKRAGYLRNKQMLDEGKPDLVVAFPGGKGTAMMIKLAKEANIKVVEIEFQTVQD